MCDDLMPAQHKRRRVIGANIVAHEKQDFHLGSSDWAYIFDSRLSDCAVAGVLPQHSPLHRLGFGLKRFEKGGGHSQRHNMRVFVIFCSVAAMALLVFAHLSPAKWKPRTGLGGP